MSDLIAILAVGLQYWLIILIIDWYHGRVLPVSISVAVFAILVAVGLALWHRTGPWQTAKQWRRSTIASLILGGAFFAIDLLWAHLHGQTNPLNYPAGLLGIPLTVAICPGFTMICIAGLVRLLYLDKMVSSHR
jgi:hypothetical protein